MECVGTPETWEFAVRVARKAAIVNLFGGCPRGTTVGIDTARVHYDELTLRGTFHHTPGTVRQALGLIADGSVPADLLVGDTASLDEVPQVLRNLAAGSQAAKVAITI